MRVTKKAGGFTLVELIVVITILGLLATIGFLSLQGYTQDARETKTAANLRTVTSSIINESAISGNPVSYYIATDAAAKLAAGNVNSGASIADANAVAYAAGKVDPAKLKIDGAKFFDAKADGTLEPFRAAAVTFNEQNRVRSMFQVAGTLKTAAGNSAVVEGTYAKVADTDLKGIIKSTKTEETPVEAGTDAVPYAL